MKKPDKALLEVLSSYADRILEDPFMIINEGAEPLINEFIPKIKKIFDYEDLEPVEIRKEKFRLEVLKRLGDYTEDELNKFYNHWTAMGAKDRLMRFEKEKTFALKQRLANWRKLSKKYAIQGFVNRGINGRK